MIIVNYSQIPKIRDDGSQKKIFCAIRRKWLLLTPEEWVRQNFIGFLVETCGYSPSLIAVEKLVKVGELKRRFDIVVFDTNALPMIVVECKEMEANLNERVLQQVLAYNITISAPFICITNGRFTFLYKRQEGKFDEQITFPKIA